MTQYIFADRVKESTATTGTGAYALGGAIAGFRSFGIGVGNNKVCFYGATDGTDWETGIGTTDGTSANLARTTVLASTNGGAAVNWGAGLKEIYVTVPSAWMARAAFGAVATQPDVSSSATAAIGSGAVANATDAIAVGKNSSAGNTNAVAVGTSANASATGAVAIGNGASASAADAIAIKGTSTSGIAIGSTASASNGGIAIGGTASASGAVALGGNASKTSSTALGIGSTVRYAGSICHGAEFGGVKQSHRTQWIQNTFNATPTLLVLSSGSGADQYAALLADKTYAWTGIVTARDTTSVKSAMWRVEGLLMTDGTGDPTFVGTPTEVQLFASAGIGAWDVAAVANTTDNRLDFSITGEASRTIKWHADIDIREVG